MLYINSRSFVPLYPKQLRLIKNNSDIFDVLNINTLNYRLNNVNMLHISYYPCSNWVTWLSVCAMWLVLYSFLLISYIYIYVLHLFICTHILLRMNATRCCCCLNKVKNDYTTSMTRGHVTLVGLEMELLEWVLWVYISWLHLLIGSICRWIFEENRTWTRLKNSIMYIEINYNQDITKIYGNCIVIKINLSTHFKTNYSAI